jgi:UDPglucose--hexose-1-phosphate uridylyltransferase
MLDLTEHPHRRFNPLTREWVLVSPHRTKRPWQGQKEKPAEAKLDEYDPGCYLCPGNSRAGGFENPKYADTFVFDNDFAALLPDTPEGEFNDSDLMVAESERGICRVICFSPRHDLTVAKMEVPAIRKVVDVWVDQFKELAEVPFINYVQIFENRGAVMGCSNPHPHCQIWSNSSIPNEIRKETDSQLAWYEQKGSPLLVDYLERELELGERVVYQNETFATVVPFWAVWPFETMVLPKRHVTGFDQLGVAERDGLADALKQTTAKYDHLFDVSFPYSMGFHERPVDGGEHREWQFHAHFYPPLLRSATVKKFMVGYELLCYPQRDITPEGAAARLM